MEKQFFEGKVEYLAEAMRLLEHIGTGKHYEEVKKELVRKYNVNTAAFEEKFRVLLEVEADAVKALRGKEEQVKEYFGNSGESEQSRSFASMALLWNGDEPPMYESVDALKKNLDTLSGEAYCKRYAEELYCYEAGVQEDFDESAYATPLDVIHFLMDMDIEEKEKWRLQTIFLKPQPHREKIFALLETVSMVLYKHAESLNTLATDFAVYWERTLKDSNIAEFISERLGFELEESPLGMGMRPSIFMPSTISVFVRVEDDGLFSTPYIYTVGVLFDDDFHIGVSGEDMKEKQEHNLKILKMLSDSSKFEILTYIKDKSAYGSELAKHLGLTTATVSHHMSALLSVGLVSMETKESRVYYSGNTKAITETLEYCQRMLTL